MLMSDALLRGSRTDDEYLMKRKLHPTMQKCLV